MAKTIKSIKFDPFKRGDTVSWPFNFTSPYDGFDWSDVTIDCALTSATAPSSNSGASALRTGQSLVVDSDNNASYKFLLTELESKALSPGTYTVEAQLRKAGSQVATAVTGVVDVVQDYII